MATRNITALARVIRSKSAKANHITFDLLFGDEATYERVKNSGAITSDVFAQLYRAPVENFVWCDNAFAVKATIRRRRAAGGLGEPDVGAVQQHVPLYAIEVPWDE